MIVCQNLILWRHADAQLIETNQLTLADEPDINRALSAKGKAQAKKMAGWLRQRLPKNTLILTSPAARAEQTALALKLDYQMVRALEPEATLEDILLVLGGLSAGNVLLVGHQPWLGLLVSYLTNLPHKQTKQVKMTSIKKSAVWWFKQSSLESASPKVATSFKLVAVQHPDFI
ncbi:MAG: SixA phosphatase family protein [Methylophilaceae bacterium]